MAAKHVEHGPTIRKGWLGMLPTNRMADVQDVAEYFRSTVVAIHQQRHRGQNPGALGIKVGKRILFDPAAIRAWVAEQNQRENVDA